MIMKVSFCLERGHRPHLILLRQDDPLGSWGFLVAWMATNNHDFQILYLQPMELGVETTKQENAYNAYD